MEASDPYSLPNIAGGGETAQHQLSGWARMEPMNLVGVLGVIGWTFLS